MVLAVSLYGAVSPPVRAQDQDIWPGTVVVDPPTLTIREGQTASYRFRLSESPSEDADDEWWVRLHIDGQVRYDGEYYAGENQSNGIEWIPSVGRELDRVDWNTWKSVSITALQDDDDSDATIGFTHEVWDHNADCPVHSVGKVTVNIIDDEAPPPPLPSLSIGDDSTEEGSTASFAVTLSPSSDREATVSYSTENGTAIAGQDYDTKTGTLTFSAGTTRQTIEVRTSNDNVDEPEETFTVMLSGPNGATLQDDSGTGTIRNSNARPVLSIEDATVVEGGRAEFEVTLSPASGQSVTVEYETSNGTAVADTDYGSASGTLTFSAGTTTQTIRVDTHEDDIDEPDESFTLTLSSASGASLEDDIATGTIIDNDEGELPGLSITDTAPVAEGGTAEFVVTLSPASNQAVSVSYSTVDGTAMAGSDFVPTSGVLRFEAGDTAQAVSVAVLVDEVMEARERSMVELRSPVGARLADGTGLATIIGDVEEQIDRVNQVLLPEMGRAVAFTPVRCRMDQIFSNSYSGATQPPSRMSLSPLPIQSGQGGAAFEAPTQLQALGDMSFALPLKQSVERNEHLSAWGCGDFSALAGDGEGGNIDWDGLVSTVQLGADLWFTPNLFTGLSMAQSSGSFDYRREGSGADAGSGERELRLTGLHSYIGRSIAPDFNVWWTVGYSWGELRSADDLLEGLLRSDATLASLAIGFGNRLAIRDDTRP